MAKIPPPESAGPAAPKTREQVRAERLAAKAAGQMASGELDYPPVQPQGRFKTRAAVERERQEQGRVPQGELDYPPAAKPAVGKTRAQIAAELQQARDAGEVTFGELDYPPAATGRRSGQG
ncbi:DUF4148 domain-containing protein [Bordetella pseudohinzii]|nr:DUF4148 domain-containing protein [Bordetella pseudohinzii]CUI59024.1 Uncharacterised protein [Bordetella pseudohinzii]